VKSHPQMTAVFNCNLRKFQGNPHLQDTPFGQPQIVGIGNAFAEHDELEASLQRLAADGKALLEALKDFGFSPEINDAFIAFARTLSDIEDKH